MHNTQPGHTVYLIDFDPCTRDKDLYLGHAFVLLDWVAEDDRFDNTPWGRTLWCSCVSLENHREYLLEPHELAGALEAYLLGYPVGL